LNLIKIKNKENHPIVISKSNKMLHQNFSKKAVFLFPIMFILIQIGCKKKETVIDKVDTLLTFNSFILEKKNNPQLSADVVFEIKDNIITGKLKLNQFDAVPTFTTNAQSVDISGQSQTSGVTKVDLRKMIAYNLTAADGSKKQYNLVINWDDNIPQINIVTNGNASITSTDIYVKADISISGQTISDEFKGTTQIRGRGNSTWSYPKKPYKIKLDTKASLLGLSAAKDWILLANYLDGTHMLNPVAMKIGKLLNMPFTNTIVPVELTLNGQYQGLYMLTEQIEVKSNRVNIDSTGTLLQLDTNFDDPWKFKSAAFQLPVMIMNPELTSATEITPIKASFEQLESLVANANFPNNNYLDYIDAESVANYLIVYMLTDNEEINHPKSTYIHKKATGKWAMGPIWDFDWAYAYEKTQLHFSSFNKPLFWSPPSVGTKFFSKMMTDPKIKTLMKQKWADFKTNKFNELLTFIDDYSFNIEGARNRDYQKWKRGSNNFKNDVTLLKTWLQNRADYMNTFIGNL
jgi:CotH kinase protein